MQPILSCLFEKQQSTVIPGKSPIHRPSKWRPLLAFLLTLGLPATMEARTVVIHLEDSTVFAGFAGESSPRMSMPAVVGRSRSMGPMIGMNQKQVYVGNEALAKQSTLNITYIVQNGVLKDYDGFEKILHHIFYNALKVEPEDSEVLIALSPESTSQNRERIIQILFETFNTQAAYVSWDPVLSLYAAQRTSGIVIQQGASYYRVTSIYEGYMQKSVRAGSGSDIVSSIKEVISALSTGQRASVISSVLITGMKVTDADSIYEKFVSVAAGDSKPVQLNFSPPPESSWRGGSILSALSTFADMWVTKDEYDESGPSIVHRKCN